MGTNFRCGRCAGWLRGSASGAASVVTCERCGHRNVCPPSAESGTRPPARLQPAAEASSAWLWVAGGCLVAGAACAVWFVSGVPAARADAPPAATNPADARQQEILKQNIDRPGDPELGSLYQAVNVKYFAGALPIMPVRWEPALSAVGALAEPAFRLEGMFGRIGQRTVILLNPAVRATPGSLERSLCHEMVHAYLYTLGDRTTNHGAHFKAELRRLSAAGAFEGISASDEEKAALKSWLDSESARIDAERADADAAGAEIARERADLDRDVAAHNARVAAGTAGGRGEPAPADAEALEQRRDAYNQRVTGINARLERDRDELAHFNREVARYNLMISYPDGMDEESAVRSKPARPGSGRR